jgi:cytochrome P450
MNPFVVQRNTDVFGADAGVFRPERWIEANEDQLRRMNAAMLSFGAGTRTCTGQHVSLTSIQFPSSTSLNCWI